VKVFIRVKNSTESNAEKPTWQPNIVPPSSESVHKQWGYKLGSWLVILTRGYLIDKGVYIECEKSLSVPLITPTVYVWGQWKTTKILFGQEC
jgi:hypothetical protein